MNKQDIEALAIKCGIEIRQPEPFYTEYVASPNAIEAFVNELTKQQGTLLEQIMAEYDATPDDGEWEGADHPIVKMAAEIDMLRAKLTKPQDAEIYGYDVFVEEKDDSYFVYDLNDHQCVDDCTNHNAVVTPLFKATPNYETLLQKYERLIEALEEAMYSNSTEKAKRLAHEARAKD